jgi:hypothetical protein
MFNAAKYARKAIVVTTLSTALLTVGCGRGAQAAPQGQFNCDLGPTALPDDRWASCAFSPDDCILGPTALPDDRWANCAGK